MCDKAIYVKRKKEEEEERECLGENVEMTYRALYFLNNMLLNFFTLFILYISFCF